MSDTAATQNTFTLQLLHASDWEAGVKALDRAANFAAIVDILEDEYENTLILSSGDGWIPGPFYASGADAALVDTYRAVYSQFFSTADAEVVFTALGAAAGRADVAIQNIIGVQAATFGNHEFDSGTSAIRDIIAAAAGADGVVGTADDVNIGTLFPYLSANLDFSGDSNLAGLFTDEIREASSFANDASKKIAPSTIITQGTEKIAVVAATTQGLSRISSPGDTKVIGATSDDIPLLAEQINAEVARILAADPTINKVIVASHLQQLSLEQALAPLLENVDIIIAGGSHTRLADENDTLREGDEAQGTYPIVTANKGGDPLLIVNTDNEYSYVGRLVVDFDAEGKIVLDSLDDTINGAYVTTDAKVAELWGDADPFAAGTKGHLVDQIIWGAWGENDERVTKGIGTVIQEQDGNIFGRTDVFLEGRRSAVRTEETNLGNLTADANLAEARKVDAEVVVSIKNGGGIRDAIGFVNAVGGEAVLAPPAANPGAGKLEGDISQLDIVNSLRFNNDLAIVTLTADGLAKVFEQGFSGVRPGATPGSFPQISGVEVVYDPSLAAGSRVVSLAVVDENGAVIDSIIANGELQGDAGRAIKVVTLTYLANGGDGYTAFVDNRVEGTDLIKLTEALAGQDGEATFAAAGTEQDAFAEYLAANYSETPFNEADTPASEDSRVVNFRELAVGVRGNELGGNDINLNNAALLSAEHGTDGFDRVFYSGADAVILPENIEQIELSGAADTSVTDNALDNVILGNAGRNDFFARGGNDNVDGGTGHDVLHVEGNADRYNVRIENGRAVLEDIEHQTTTTITNVQRIVFSDGEQNLFATDQTEIAGIYRALLGRAAETDGFSYWAGRSADGVDLRGLISAIGASDEAAAFQEGKSTEELVDALYTNLLGRDADAEGRAYWINQIDSDVLSFNLVGLSFVASDEFQLGGRNLVGGDWNVA
ncbi:MAG: 5'-nucleotidase C-terminal domain-containing protein [Pseudochelatococcus sp.]|jgi:2',3'-cyclic-nucleotide 2'-phosphodiesterase (5'-nucleotidase family)|uniref:5'-nucleotidase C-terminal domain-containing protein n=1 Tax=Pseudochelatococcus sp. TaxID=2020869 RepID=UPI003D8F0C15